TGAATTWRGRIRVCPSSSSVTSRGARLTGAVSTTIAAGRSHQQATPTTARSARTTESGRRDGGRIGSLPRLEDGDEIEAVEPPADERSRESRRDGHRRDRERDGRARDDERDAEELRLEADHDQATESVAEGEAERQRQGGQHRLLSEEHRRHLAARKAEDAQARKLAAALRERDARPVV